MSGYLTEKLFDCFYAGTVPVYLGAPDIETLVPSGAFIDMRKFSSYEEMLDQLLALSEEEWHVMREVARDFLKTQGASVYQNSLLNVVRI